MNNKAFVLTSINHVASVEDSYVTHSDQSEFAYSNNFSCTPFDVPFRPPRFTPKPVVQGTQTAIVTGPAGETIYPDKYGRVKVKFHWDRENKNDDTSSCWIRVSQAWAGQSWGSMHIPHVGQEVIVDFIEGDPDRPLITGRLYHANNMPADALPGEKTKSVFRDHGGNEQIVEGKDGDKHIVIKQACGNEIRMHESSPDIEIKQECGNEILMKASGPDIDIKQACGNHILMRESEGIHMKDKYGNEVKLDAVAGTLKLRSPTHESFIELGKSAWIGTMSDLRKEIKGDAFSVVHGSKDELVAGPVKLKWDGTNVKLHGGLVQDTFYGGKWSSLIGAQLTTNYAFLFERSRSRTFKRVDDLIKIDSQKETQVIGGGGKADTSKLQLTGSFAKLRSGESNIVISKDGKINIKSNKDIYIDANNDIIITNKNKKVIIECDTVKFICKTVDFGKATLDGGKEGTIFG
jgi:hypothetical protein